MTNLVDQSIAELRATHDRLAAHVPTLTADDLAATSGGAEAWTVADVLSHLGSGAEISRHTLLAALGDGDLPQNQDIWDRWNALTPADQAADFIESDRQLVELYESLTPDQRATTTVDLGFLPAPVPLATALGMRLNEQTLHAWDVEVGADPAAALSDSAAELMVEHYLEGMGFLLGFIGKAGELDEPVRLTFGDRTLAITDSVALETGTDDATATYAGPVEAVVRLLTGRLGQAQTPADAEVTGNVTLDDLRRVFPGY